MQLYPPAHYDDKANGYTLIRTVPLSSAMGAEIRGVRLPTMDDAQLAQVKAALCLYKMVFFRDKKLTIDDQEKPTLHLVLFDQSALCTACPTLWRRHLVGQ